VLKEWQFNILFFVGVGGAVFLLIGPEFGLNISENPTALAGVGSILTYILTQRSTLTRHSQRKRREREETPYPSPYDDDEEQREER
jgi:hypothetical protein